MKRKKKVVFPFLTPSKDIKRDKGNHIIEWYSRGNKKYNLTSEKASKNIIHLPTAGRYALDFHNSRYFNGKCEAFFNTKPGSYGYICVTFHVQAEGEQTILTNYDSSNPGRFNEISASNTEIYIWGRKEGKTTHTVIQHKCREWTTLFVEWYNTKSHMYGNYNINDEEKSKGAFTFDHNIPAVYS